MLEIHDFQQKECNICEKSWQIVTIRTNSLTMLYNNSWLLWMLWICDFWPALMYQFIYVVYEYVLMSFSWFLCILLNLILCFFNKLKYLIHVLHFYVSVFFYFLRVNIFVVFYRIIYSPYVQTTYTFLSNRNCHFYQ